MKEILSLILAAVVLLVLLIGRCDVHHAGGEIVPVTSAPANITILNPGSATTRSSLSEQEGASYGLATNHKPDRRRD